MRTYRIYVRIAALMSLLLLTNCGDRDTTKAIPATETKPSAIQQQAAAATQKCENGATPKVLAGECSGVWSVKKADDGAMNCEFDWKPTVRCPAGSVAVGLQSACYGVTSRPAESAKTSNECAAAHGKFPISPAYKLECCPL